jgi:hypothetical protein
VQNPAYMVFACLVADQDLLFVAYEVPCISICRAEQRAKALERLGLPQGVYQDIQDRGGNAPSVTGGTLDKASKRTVVKPDLAGDEEMDANSLVDTWKKVVDINNREPSPRVDCCGRCASPQMFGFEVVDAVAGGMSTHMSVGWVPQPENRPNIRGVSDVPPKREFHQRLFQSFPGIFFFRVWVSGSASKEAGGTATCQTWRLVRWRQAPPVASAMHFGAKRHCAMHRSACSCAIHAPVQCCHVMASSPHLIPLLPSSVQPHLQLSPAPLAPLRSACRPLKFSRSCISQGGLDSRSFHVTHPRTDLLPSIADPPPCCL